MILLNIFNYDFISKIPCIFGWSSLICSNVWGFTDSSPIPSPLKLTVSSSLKIGTPKKGHLFPTITIFAGHVLVFGSAFLNVFYFCSKINISGLPEESKGQECNLQNRINDKWIVILLREAFIYIYICFLKWWYPHFTPPKWSFLVEKKHGFVGETHHFRKPPQNTAFVRKGHFSNLQWHIGDVGMLDPTGQNN